MGHPPIAQARRAHRFDRLERPQQDLVGAAIFSATDLVQPSPLPADWIGKLPPPTMGGTIARIAWQGAGLLGQGDKPTRGWKTGMGSPKHSTDLDIDYTVDQNWKAYTQTEHDTWTALYDRQSEILPERACDEYLEGLKRLDLNNGGIPNFDELNEELSSLTDWNVVAVPDLVPDGAFFKMLANRRFPAGCFMRKPEQMDYLSEPDVFHDVYGHVPMLSHPVFADYMQAYGEGGLRSLEFGALHHIARLYWYTVEFGLMQSSQGLRIYGAGILSSKSESIFCLESPSPHRIRFQLERVMSTEYRIDDFQQTYFVIEDFDQLLSQTSQDFTALYERLKTMSTIEPIDPVAGSEVIHGGDQSYARAKRAA